MISVIVPVFNVEPFLHRSIDSILNQTYKDIEIILVDDGSTDRSGEICDEYADNNSKVVVFHTDNHGLSAARNLGLDHASGEYIGFVDPDDWIEPDMYEVLINKATFTDSDIVECGIMLEYSNRTEVREGKESTMTGMEAVSALLKEELYNSVWNKVWKHHCFDCCRFPEGRVFEDVAITYKVFAKARRVCTIAEAKYHYFQRPDGISQDYDIDNLVGFWLSNKERYHYLSNKINENENQLLLMHLAFAVARTWAHYCDCDSKERDKYQNVISEMSLFVNQSFPAFGCSGWRTELRIGLFFSRFCNILSFRMAWIVNRLHRATKSIINGL